MGKKMFSIKFENLGPGDSQRLGITQPRFDSGTSGPPDLEILRL